MIKKIKHLLLENRGTRQTITKNVFWLGVSQIGSRLIRAALVIFAARILGTEGYGQYSYALGLAGFFSVFVDLGISLTVTREAAKNLENRIKYFSTGFWIKIVLAIITTVVIFILVPTISKIPEMNVLIPFIVLIVLFDSFRDFFISFFRAKEKMEFEALITILTNLTITGLGLGILFISNSATSLLMMYAVAVGIGTIIAAFFAREELKQVISGFEKILIRPIVISSAPVVMVGVIGTFMANTDMVMLGWWRTLEEIGFYSAGQKIILTMFSIPAILASAIFPTLSRLIGDGEKENIKSLMEKSVLLSLLIALPLSIGGVILANQLIVLFYGEAYLPGTLVFQIFIVSFLINFPATLIGNAYVAYNKQKQLAKYMSAAAITNIFLNWLLIPFYGIVGAAIATVSSQWLNNTLAWRSMKIINGFSTFRHIKNMIIAVIVMALFTIIIKILEIHVILNVTISSFMYFATLYFLGERTLDEFRIILRGIYSKFRT